jgi:hypothetical protein
MYTVALEFVLVVKKEDTGEDAPITELLFFKCGASLNT